MRGAVREQLVHALLAFRAGGNHFVSPDAEWREPENPSEHAELRVLRHLLEAWTNEAGAVIYFRARGVRSPVFEVADLVVAHPSIGFVVVEVKSHMLAGLDLSDGQLVARYGERKKPVDKQARDQVKYLLDLLREERARKHVYQSGSYLIALPSIARAVFQESPLARAGHLDHHLIFADDLEPNRLRDLCRVAAQHAAKRSKVTLPTSSEALRLLRQVLGELDTSETISGSDVIAPNAGTLRERIDRIHVSNCLDPQQRDLAIGHYEKHPLLIRGVAGSGKSLILARNLVTSVARRQPGTRRGRYLVTCFNRSLVPLLRELIERTARHSDVDLAGCEITVSHFEGVMREIGKRFNVPVASYRTPDSERCPALLALLDQTLAERPELAEALPEMIYVDEAQDLNPESLRLLHALCRPHPETGERGFVMAYDDAQNLYGRSRPVWKDLGINLIGGRSRVLNESRRTTRPIATFAFNVLLGSALENQLRAGTRVFADVAHLVDVGAVLELNDGFVVDFAQRSGLLPRVDVLGDVESEAQHVATAVMDLVRDERVRPEEILIQSDDRWGTLDPIRAALAAMPGAPPHHVIRDDKDALAIRAGSVAFSTIHSAKGYDAPIVFLVNANGFGTSSEDRARFYVGATRAQMLLVVTAHGNPQAGLLQEMLEVRRRLPALATHDTGSPQHRPRGRPARQRA